MCDKDTEIDILRSKLQETRTILDVCHALILDELVLNNVDTSGRAEKVINILKDNGIGNESPNIHAGHLTQNGL